VNALSPGGEIAAGRTSSAWRHRRRRLSGIAGAVGLYRRL